MVSMNLKIIKTIIILFLFLFTSALYAESTVKIMPDELLEIAEKVNCNQVTDFFNRPGMIESPYVYGFLPGPQENSAVYWCQKRKSNNKYLLVLSSKKSLFDDWNYEIIIETDNYPRGLSIVKNCKITLDKFSHISTPRKHGPKNILPSSNVILSTYDGVSEYYYNYMGSWLIYQTD